MPASESPNYNTDDPLRLEEKGLDSLSNEYIELREQADNRFSPGKHRIYALRVGVCIGMFIASLSISYGLLSLYHGGFVSTGLSPVILSISVGIIMAMIFIIDDNLKTQRLNEKLAAKSYEIKLKRSKILLILQERALNNTTR